MSWFVKESHIADAAEVARGRIYPTVVEIAEGRGGAWVIGIGDLHLDDFPYGVALNMSEKPRRARGMWMIPMSINAFRSIR